MSFQEIGIPISAINQATPQFSAVSAGIGRMEAYVRSCAGRMKSNFRSVGVEVAGMQSQVQSSTSTVTIGFRNVGAEAEKMQREVLSSGSLMQTSFSQVGMEAGNMAGAVSRAGDQAAMGLKQVSDQARVTSIDFKSLVTQMSGVLTSGLALYGMWTRIQGAQIAVAAATKEVHESHVTIAEYQKRLNRLVEEGKTGTEEYALLQERVGVNEELLAVKTDRLAMAQQNVTTSYVYAAATVVPTMITAVSNLQGAYTALTAVKGSSITATIAHSAADLKGAIASKAAAAATWLLNSSLAMKISLLTLGVGLIATTAAYMHWLASTTRDAARAQTEYNASLTAMPERTPSIRRAGKEEMYRRGVE